MAKQPTKWLAWKRQAFPLFGLGMFLLAFCTGCTLWRKKQHDLPLVTARQLSLRGMDSLHREEWTDAEAYFSEALQSCQTDERAHWGYAEALWRRGDRNKAIEHLQQAVRLSGSNPDLQVRLGKMFLEEGYIEQASQQVQAALVTNRRHAGAWELQGDILVHRQKWSEALESYHRALAYQSDSTKVQLAIADLYRKLNRPQRALATLDRLSDKLPRDQINAEASLLRGLALSDLGQEKEAQACFAAASTHATTGDASFLLRLVEAHIQSGDLVQARMVLGQALQLSPENPQAAQLRSQLDQSFQRWAAESSAGQVLR